MTAMVPYQQQGRGLLDRLAEIVVPTQTRQNSSTTNIGPETFGIPLDFNVNQNSKKTISDLARMHPGEGGLTPDAKAKLNMAMKLSAKAKEDAVFYTKSAKTIMENTADIYESELEHKQNAMKIDRKVKKAEVEYVDAFAAHKEESKTLEQRMLEATATIRYLDVAV